MLTPEENELLCRVEGEAPMGEIMRRHWLPACLSEEIEEPDGDPVRVRLLGEDLVAFRDTDGRVGVLDEMCPHRRASLVLGRNEECGLRCLYHGWKMDVDGNVLEMSSEPPESKMTEKVKHKAYPTHEAAGFVWVYMGPPDEQPEFTAPVFQPTPDTKVSISKVIIDCNWAQILEGAIDSAHSSSLHSTDMVPARTTGAEATDTLWLRPSTDKAPRLQVQKTRFGFRYAAIRRPIKDAKTHDYVRTTLFIAPYTVQIPPNNQYDIAILHVPIDDTHTAFHFIAWGDAATTPDTESWRKFLGTQIGIDVDKSFRKFRTRENNYWQDRRIMQLGTSFTGIKGIPNQDIAMWETMGPIADRTHDRLGASDLAIVEFRRQMLQAAKTMQQGGTAIGAEEPRIPHYKLKSFQGIVTKETDWRELGTAPEEAEYYVEE
ncbi:Rieske 2Fe-2S domain-containing protein [Vreelandella alkaliphila]|jgi:phthalate 4,5-dioxygenase oxygenase subunit|uniref:MarR family transcriptional regulator n=1 Tax=Vreelandella aquamarina TaxID=77097 RepID=A0A857GPI5_9GAMM|nr:MULTISPECIES: Rieske 2Fe-2S domain-containing protein [Halomonas]QHD51199.1 MarR family transcriptional regulator [Halomonas meridiana]QPL45910.1 Rieske 2Fe-2S domain-containing protein [Halomonas sp. A40-4]|tara:strand:+ start:362 stop:1657 length:1296 start_codon:yes stop_codon:yes gene_type:complete